MHTYSKIHMWHKYEENKKELSVLVHLCIIFSFIQWIFFQNIQGDITDSLLQRLENYGPWAKSGLPSVFVNKVL